jgi:hypothetical protein
MKFIEAGENIMKKNIFNIFVIIFIISLSRIIPHPPNFTPILASAVMAPLLLKDRSLGILVTILSMFITDLIIGFHSYQFVIYFTLLTISLITPVKKNYISLLFISIAGSCWFYITTNFAVWLIWDYYPKNLNGLINCYTLALPFFKNTLISTVLFSGIIIASIKYLYFLNEKINFLIFNFMNNKTN